jgi:ribosomal protein S18 acetylase RimI-like enzyme
MSLWRTLGCWKFLRLLPIWIRLARKTGFEDPDFYLSNIAVYPEYRCLGIGRYLLEYAETYCGRKRLVLDVANENYGAKKFYFRHGYQIEREWKFGGKKYLRLAKSVNTEIKT